MRKKEQEACEKIGEITLLFIKVIDKIHSQEIDADSVAELLKLFASPGPQDRTPAYVMKTALTRFALKGKVSITEFLCPSREASCVLFSWGIVCVKDLVSFSYDKLSMLAGFTEDIIDELECALERFGLWFGMDDQDIRRAMGEPVPHFIKFYNDCIL